MKENRSEILILRLTPKEKTHIRQRMADMGVQNMSAFIRKMALNGYCVHLDMTELTDIVSQLRRLNANLNQYTKRAHVSGNVYQEDVEDLVARTDDLQTAVSEIMRTLQKIVP
jgi:hypothetical protein